METNEVVKELATKIKIPKGVKEAIFERLFKNICIAIVFILYLIFLNMGYVRLNHEVFEADLHIFAGILIVLTIFTIELAYKKKDTKTTIHGVELLALSIITLFMPYIYFHRGMLLKFIYGFISVYIAIYYLIKCIVIYIIEANKYKKGLSDIKEIIDDDDETYLDEENERKFNYLEVEENDKNMETEKKITKEKGE